MDGTRAPRRSGLPRCGVVARSHELQNLFLHIGKERVEAQTHETAFRKREKAELAQELRPSQIDALCDRRRRRAVMRVIDRKRQAHVRQREHPLWPGEPDGRGRNLDTVLRAIERADGIVIGIDVPQHGQCERQNRMGEQSIDARSGVGNENELGVRAPVDVEDDEPVALRGEMCEEHIDQGFRADGRVRGGLERDDSR